MAYIKEGQVIEITKEHIDRTTDDGRRIHALYSALYDATGGEISMIVSSNGGITSVHINGVLYILCDRIRRWIQAYEANDGKVSPIKMELLISEDGERILTMNYN